MASSSPRKLPAREQRFLRREVESGRYRTAFQRDRDRVLYSPAFRRLAGITQCASASHGHVFHNRLTHSLKVAQLGSRLAMYLLHPERTSADIIEAIGGINADVVETACLCHDLGHPPFGHAAELELNRLIQEKSLLGGFEGNAQSFHMVTSVIQSSHEYTGLNLTRASLDAIMKYPWPHSAAEKEKWGYFAETDQDYFDWVRDTSAWGSTRNKSPEAGIMDWADDVAYSIHDIDDFFRAGFVPLNQLVRPSGEQYRFIDWAKRTGIVSSKEFAQQFLGNLATYSPRLFEEDFHGTKEQLAALSIFTGVLITRYLGWNPDDRVTVSLQDRPPYLKIHDTLLTEVKLLKSLMEFYVYDSPSIVAEQFGQRKVMSELFVSCFDAIVEGKYSSLISPPFYNLIPQAVGNNELVARLVVDFITSMTEQQALSLFGRVTGASPGSIRDPVLH